MSKSPDAFRTISEVAEWLDRPAHVLRFWESKFSQVKPIKRAGGRRYFRPQDMLLLGGIKKLLHDDGLTIKGVQKILREEGVEHVSSLSQPLDDQGDSGALVPSPEKVAALKAKADNPESATLLQFPTGPEAAEEELSAANYEEAAEDLAPSLTEDEEVGAPEGPSAPVADPEPEPAPSFFSMFEEETEETPTPDTPADPEPPHPEPAEPDAAEEAGIPADAPAMPTLTPDIVDVPVEAVSQSGPGILSRLLSGKAALRAADPQELDHIRERLTALRGQFANNAANG